MDLEVSPEPAPAELEALAEAVERLLAPPPQSAWWQEGIRENVLEEVYEATD